MDVGDQIEEKEKNIFNHHRFYSLIVILSFVLLFLDISMVYLSLPFMSLDFQATYEVRWMILSSFLPMLGVPFVMDVLCKRFGTRKIALIGISTFTIGSALCGTALLFWQLVFYRTIQGVGGLLLITSIVNILRVELRKGLEQLIQVAMLGAIIGLIVGGFLMTYWNWHLNFLILTPVGLSLYYLCLWFLPQEMPDSPTNLSKFRTQSLMPAVLLIAMGLSPYSKLGGIPTILLFVIGVIIFLVWFVKIRSLFPRFKIQTQSKNPAFFIPTMIFIHSLIGGSLCFLLPFYLIKEQELNTITTGGLLLIVPLIVLLFIFIYKRWLYRFSFDLNMLTSFALILIGSFLSLSFDPNWGFFDWVIRIGLLGVGYGLFLMGLLTQWYKESFSENHFSILLIRLMGWVMGPVLCTLIWTPNMIDSLLNLPDLRLVFFLFIVLSVLSLLSIVVMRWGSRFRFSKTQQD